MNTKGCTRVELICEECEAIFTRKRSEINRTLRKKHGCRLCSQACSRLDFSSAAASATCKECDKSFTQTISSLKGFCNHSCSASFNNHTRVRKLVWGSAGGNKSIENLCRECGKYRKSDGRDSLCRPCRKLTDIVVFGRRRIKSFTAVSARHKYQGIRSHAHRVAKLYNFKKTCSYLDCGYSRKVELAHIKAISSFEKETPLYIVNDPKNLAYLCPTHHYELDDGILGSSLIFQISNL